MNNTIDINQAENDILLSLNGTLIPEYDDGNEHEFYPGKTYELKQILTLITFLGMIYPLAGITNICVPLLILKWY